MPAVKKIKAKIKTNKKKIIKKPLIKKKAIKKLVVKKTKALSKKGKSGNSVKPVKLKEKVLGKVTHYYSQVRAAVVKVKAPFSVGDKIRIKGHTTDFTQDAVSIQVDRTPINTAKKGQEIGLLVNSRVRQHDLVYKL